MRISDWSSDVCSSDLKSATRWCSITRLTANWLCWARSSSPNSVPISSSTWNLESGCDEVLSTILNTTICRALAFFDFALETGEEEPIDSARALLATAVSLADNAENIPLWRSAAHTSELQSLMRFSYAVFCLNKQNTQIPIS